MKTKPNPEVFARTVLSELARLRGEVFALRLRLYEHMAAGTDYETKFQEMMNEDEAHIKEMHDKSISDALQACGLSPDPTPPDADDLYA